MNILVTAGNTQVPIDRVRCITNVFTGRTGAMIALHARERGHAMTLLTSHPEIVRDLSPTPDLFRDHWDVQPYRTFGDLERLMEQALRGASFHALIHTAAVSDYRTTGIFAPAKHTRFHAADRRWLSLDDRHPCLEDRAAGKIKSDDPELWLRLARTPKLIDRVRSDWGFGGVLIKFKLEVGLSEDQLRDIAEPSRRQSGADCIVANTLDEMQQWALLGPIAGEYLRVSRAELAPRLLDAVEKIHEARGHG